MNDFERRLRDLGERAKDDVAGPLRPAPAALRRIGRRRAVVTTTACACVATIVAAGAYAWTGQAPGDRSRRVPPAAETTVPGTRGCARIPFEPTYVPDGFDREAELEPGEEQPGVIGVFHGNRAASIQVTTPHYAFVQTRPRPIEVLDAPATIGMIHEGYSVAFRHDECEYVLNGYGVTRSELRRFATGLVPRGAPTHEPALVSWPEDALEEAEAACAGAGPRERTAPAVVSRFATDVLGWESPVYEAPRRPSGPWTVTPLGGDAYGGKVDAGVRVWTTEVVPGCWSVSSASRLADRRPTGVGVSVDGEIVDIGYDPLGATAATIEVGYGGRNRRVHDRIAQGHVRIRLRFTPETTGHFLVLLRDEDGDVFTAYASPLPPGDFAAG